MAIVFCSTRESKQTWSDEFRRQAPNMDFRIWPNAGNLCDIRHAIVSRPQPGVLASLPNLTHIHSLWAGLDHITCDPDWPHHVPVIRMVDPGLSQGMMEFMLGHTLRYHLNMPFFEAEQITGRWSWQPPPLAENRSVGILGLGTLGQITAQSLKNIGFKLSGWSRRKKNIDGITSYAGEAELDSFLSQVDILLCLLPNTPDTNNLLNAKRLAMMPYGSRIINAGRGELICDDDLLKALDSGQIAAATLDVFRVEPLPDDHPYWSHPKVTLTPHVAAETRLETGVATILKNIAYLEKGGKLDSLPGVMDKNSGY